MGRAASSCPEERGYVAFYLVVLSICNIPKERSAAHYLDFCCCFLQRARVSRRLIVSFTFTVDIFSAYFSLMKKHLCNFFLQEGLFFVFFLFFCLLTVSLS